MRKYFTFLKTYIASSLEYRAATLTWLLVELVGLSSGIFLWSAIYRTNRSVGGYNFNQIVLYYVLVPLIGSLTSVFVTEMLPRRIKYGQISSELLKPYSISMAVFVQSTSMKLVQLVVRMPAYILVTAIIFFAIGATLNPINVIIALFVCVFSYILHFFIDLCISYAAFWMDDVWALSHLKYVALMIFGGMSFPLDLVPKSLQVIFNSTPFRFIYFFPVSVVQGKLSNSEIIKQLLFLLLWLVIFFVLSKVLWKLGIKKYGAFGN